MTVRKLTAALATLTVALATACGATFDSGPPEPPESLKQAATDAAWAAEQVQELGGPRAPDGKAKALLFLPEGEPQELVS